MRARTTIDFGIDLGTSNSTIAVIEGTDARVIPNRMGSTVTPSAVWINRRGNLQVGYEAKERTLVTDWENGDVEFKLRMGLGSEGAKVFARSRRRMLPEELSAEILKSLKTDAEANLGERITAAVITVPAAFELPQNKATQRAAELAGFDRAPLLLEPVAASLAYGFQSEETKSYWMIYDFGGGTFDAALMRVRDGSIQVANHNGDNHLGGKLIDWDIVTKVVIPALTEEYRLPDFRRGNPRWVGPIGRLKFAVEKAKIEVCRTQREVEIDIESLCQDAEGRTVEVFYTLTPQEVADISRPYVERSLRLCRHTLEEKGLKGGDLDRILMVGGSTLNPWVREAVGDDLGVPLEFGIDPVTVVARGAAIFASTQSLPKVQMDMPSGTWQVLIESEPVGSESDPDIGGRVIPDAESSARGCTIELRDKKTRWSTGSIGLNEDGVFMTQLFAEKKRRCEFEIELLDPTGRRIPTMPESIFYTIGVPPAKPPCPQTIGIALADGSVAPFIPKGKTLPARGRSERRTTVPLRANRPDDEIRIPVLEGENERAARNHWIGELLIRGTDVSRDLPLGSTVEIAIKMDESLQVHVSAFVPVIDDEFEVRFDKKMVRKSLDVLLEEQKQQEARIASLEADHAVANDSSVGEVLERIEREDRISELESLAEAAEQDEDALSQLDRRLLDLAAEIDHAEDAAAWPKAMAEAKEAKESLKQAIDTLPDVSQADRKNQDYLEQELDRMIASGDLDQLKRGIAAIERFRFEILARNPAFWVAQLGYLEKHSGAMSDKREAQRLITQGHRAIAQENWDELRSTVAELYQLLSSEIQQEMQNQFGSTVQ